MACMEAWLLPAGGAARAGSSGGAWLIAAACVFAHACSPLATLAAAGQLPDWGQYLAYLRAFLFEPAGRPQLRLRPLVAGPRRRRRIPGLRGGDRPARHSATAGSASRRAHRDVIALTGTTAYGIAIYSYFDNRSTDFALVGVALPAPARRRTLAQPAPALSSDRRAGGPASGGSPSPLGRGAPRLAVGWSSIGERYPALGARLRHSRRPVSAGALHRLWHLPPLNTRLPRGGAPAGALHARRAPIARADRRRTSAPRS